MAADGGVSRAIVAVPLDGSAADAADAVRVLVTGADFFAFPTPSPDGTRLAWINWNHPRMPWDGTELRTGPAAGTTVAESGLVMGGPEESALAPLWRDNDSLYAASDASGWWNLYLVPLSGGAPRPVCPREEEFAEPLWQLGGRPFALLGDGRLAVTHGAGEQRLGVLDPSSGELTDPELGFRVIQGTLAVAGTTIAAVAGGPRTPWSVIATTPGGSATVLREQAVAAPDPAYLPDARQVRLVVGAPARGGMEGLCPPRQHSPPRQQSSTPSSIRRLTRTWRPRTVSSRRTSCMCTAAPPRTRCRCSTWRRSTSPAAGSA